MVKHIVLFKLIPMASEAEKSAKMMEIKTGLEALSGIVSCLRSIEVGLNDNPAEAYDIALITTFDNMDDMRAYAVHPAHLEVLKVIGAVKEERACVDFTY